MTEADIRRVQADVGARRPRSARDAGYDIVYAYGAHTYLPAQFLSPFYNRRSDEYGGSLVNRARFWLEAARDAGRRRRRRLRDRGADGGRPGGAEAGIQLDEGARVHPARRPPRGPVGRQHRLDLARVASTPARRGSSRRAGSSSGRAGCGARPAKPIVGVGRLTNPDQMAEIVRAGVWDVIGAARPSIADPFLPREDRGGPLRRDPRVHRLQPVHRAGRLARHLGCTQNATAGRGVPPRLASGAVRAGGERRRRTCSWSAPARPGMECAIVLAQARLRARAPGRRATARSAGSCAGCRGCPDSASGARVARLARGSSCEKLRARSR